jgi:prepilin-type N-terminal cleavage/methylation domain-containing protein
MTRGFSLIEMIVYIALLALIMAGSIASVYQITQNSMSLSNKNTTQEEGNFVLRKFSEALTGAYSPLDVTGGACDEMLDIVRYDGTDIDIQRSGKSIVLDRGPGFEALTTDNVEVTCLDFEQHTGALKGVTMTATIDGETFTLTRYVRE